MEGETIVDCTPVIGYLHRSMEKIFENRTYMQGIRLCRVAIDRMPPGPIAARVPIALRPPRGETYFAIENSRGEYGYYLISDGSEYPWRMKMRAPSFVNLQILPELLRGHKLSDAVAIIRSTDIVLGCVDR